MSRIMKEIFDVRYGKITITWTDNNNFEVVQILNKRIVKQKTFKTFEGAKHWVEKHYFSSRADIDARESAKSESDALNWEVIKIREWDRQNIVW